MPIQKVAAGLELTVVTMPTGCPAAKTVMTFPDATAPVAGSRVM